MPLSMAQSTVRANTVRGIVVEAEDEAAIYHDAVVVQSFDDLPVISAEILAFGALFEIVRAQSFEADEQTAQPGLRCHRKEPAV